MKPPKRKTVDAALQLDSCTLLRSSYINSGTLPFTDITLPAVSPHWGPCSIGVQLRCAADMTSGDASDPVLTVAYDIENGTPRSRPFHSAPISYDIPIAPKLQTPMGHKGGGFRWYFRCPCCNARKQILYLTKTQHVFACRTCAQLTYRSSQQVRCKTGRHYDHTIGQFNKNLLQGLLAYCALQDFGTRHAHMLYNRYRIR